MPTIPTRRTYRTQSEPGISRVFVGVRVSASNAAVLRRYAKRHHKGNVSAAVESLIEGSKTGGAVSTTHPARPRTSLRQHAGK